MPASNLRGYWREKPTPAASFAIGILSIEASFDPTSSSQILLGVLPKGAIPLQVWGLGGATGGASPTVDIGTSGNDDGFADELAADANDFTGEGALTGIPLTADTEVYGKVGASAAAGGSVTVLILYKMQAE